MQVGTTANEARHRIAAQWRMLLKPKGPGWAARGELERYCDTRSQVVRLNVKRKDDSVMRSCPLSPRGGGVTGNGGVSSTLQTSRSRVARWTDCGEGRGRVM